MITDFKRDKADVLKQYDSIMPLIKEIKGNDETTYDAQLEQLHKDVENIRKDIFRLMVVGEAKSGKSTFINAYLGKKILPMDYKQCTSAIIEIRYGDKYLLKATYGDDTVRTLTDEAEITKFLWENAAMDDKYRDIPVGIINLQLIIPNKGRQATSTETATLLKMIEKDNSKLPQAEYNRKVKDYIEAQNPHWRSLIKTIEIEYPFEDEDLKGIHIIDTPGVGAEGRVGEITEKYISNANALMFLKPVVGAALDTTSFGNFLEKVGKGRAPDAMFLILTRAANENSNTVASIREDACTHFPNINKKQIIHVDSKAELFRKKVETMTEEELQDFMDYKINENEDYEKQNLNLSEEERHVLMEKQKDLDLLDSFLETPWHRSHCRRETYLEKLSEISNFKEIDYALSLFARKAQYLLMSEALGRMLSVLCKIKSVLSDNIRLYKEKSEDPAELECKLRNAELALGDLEKRLNVNVNKIASKYKDSGGIIESNVSTILETYKKEMQNINPKGETSVSELEKLTFRTIGDFRKVQDNITKEIITECEKTLISYSKKKDLNYTVLSPDITPAVLEKIKSEKMKAAQEEYTTGICFKKGTKLNQSRYFSSVRDYILEKLNNVPNDIVIALQEYATAVTSSYRNELVRNIKIQSETNRKICEDKANAEEMQKKIQDMECKRDKLNPFIYDISSLKGGIDKNV